MLKKMRWNNHINSSYIFREIQDRKSTMTFRTLFASILFSLFYPVLAMAGPAEIRQFCYANAWESCHIVIKGEIGLDTAALFQTATEQMEGNQVLLHSEGGDPMGAMALGRLIRKLGYNTIVGQDDKNLGDVAAGTCRNACLYALAGGVSRWVSESDSISFDWSNPFPEDAAQQKGVVLASTYLIEMGVDPSLLSRGTNSPELTLNQLQDLAIAYVPPSGFGHFVMEPYKEGVVVTSARLDRPNIYDRISQLTIYCRTDADIYFLMTAEGDFVAEEGLTNLDYWTEINQGERGNPNSIDISGYKTWTGNGNAFIEFQVERARLPELSSIAALAIRFDPGRAMGGIHWADIELNSVDQQMLAAALKSCI